MPVTPEDVKLAKQVTLRYRSRQANVENDDLTSDALLALSVAVDYWDEHPTVHEQTRREPFLVRRISRDLIDGLRCRHGKPESGYARQHFEQGMLRLDRTEDFERPLSEIIGDEDHDLEAVDADVVLAELLDTLPPREREILVRTTLKGETQIEVAASFDITESRVSQIRARALDRLRGSPQPSYGPRPGMALSEREAEVLTHIAAGESNAEIATALLITEETAKTHLRHILAKLQARSRAHAVAIGFRRGVLR